MNFPRNAGARLLAGHPAAPYFFPAFPMRKLC